MRITTSRVSESLLELIDEGMIIGLGSGRTVSALLDDLIDMLIDKGVSVRSLRFIPTSLQIKLRAEHLGLNIADDSLIPYINLVIDGADQIDEHMNMIKGGGGALLREKVLIHATSRLVIVADESKYVDRFDMPIPVEVLPYARSYVINILKSEFMADTSIRVNERGYPVVTENGNIIIDAKIDMEKYYKNGGLSNLENHMKCIAGVIETGLFTKHANIYYRIMKDGSTEVIYT